MVLEPDAHQVQVIGRPIPACESDPVSREVQDVHMARFLGVSRRWNAAVASAGREKFVSDPSFTHWVLEDGRIIGEARSVEKADDVRLFAFVRLFTRLNDAEHGSIATKQLQLKNGQVPA